MSVRFILKLEVLDRYSGAQYERLYTLDMQAPELERELCRGGMSQEAYELVSLVGAEVIKEPA